jgi:hypothetical protein
MRAVCRREAELASHGAWLEVAVIAWRRGRTVHVWRAALDAHSLQLQLHARRSVMVPMWAPSMVFVASIIVSR